MERGKDFRRLEFEHRHIVVFQTITATFDHPTHHLKCSSI